MTAYAAADTVVVLAQFYEQDASGGEDSLANPETPVLIVTDSAGAQIAGSPFAMAAPTPGQTGVVYATFTAAAGTFAYVCVDTGLAETISHTAGIIKVETNDFDSTPDAVWDEPLAGHATAGTAGKKLSDQTNPDNAAIADAVWDEPLAGHATPGTAGKKLSDQTNPDNATIADTVWDEATADHTSAGTFGKKVGDITLTTDAAVADAVWDEATAGHATAGTFGKYLSESIGPGGGTISVTKDTGGANVLRPEVSGVAQQNVVVRAFLTSDYDDGNRTNAYTKGIALSDADGDFQLWLAAAAYTIAYYRIRSGATDGISSGTTTVTVS